MFFQSSVLKFLWACTNCSLSFLFFPGSGEPSVVFWCWSSLWCWSYCYLTIRLKHSCHSPLNSSIIEAFFFYKDLSLTEHFLFFRSCSLNPWCGYKRKSSRSAVSERLRLATMLLNASSCCHLSGWIEICIRNVDCFFATRLMEGKSNVPCVLLQWRNCGVIQWFVSQGWFVWVCFGAQSFCVAVLSFEKQFS